MSRWRRSRISLVLLLALMSAAFVSIRHLDWLFSNVDSSMVQNKSNSTRRDSLRNTTSTTSTVSPPIPFSKNGPAGKRYSVTPFQYPGYRPTGGRLPFDPVYHLSSWQSLDNATCIHKNKSSPRRQVPYAILLGAMKAGTHAVTESLWEHDQVIRTRGWELPFFDSKGVIRNNQGIDRDATLQNYDTALHQFFPNQTTNDKLAIISSPGYLWSSDRVPNVMLCVTPWVKLLAILRDPIARVESHYRFLDETRRKLGHPMVDWKEWIDDDLHRLEAVLQATTPAQEVLAWKHYQRSPNSHQIVGRGLYVICLQDYFRAMQRVGKPKTDLFIMQSERFRQHRQEEYNRLLDFLDLPPHQLSNVTDTHTTSKEATTMPMPISIRDKLRDIYRPYNQRLYNLLNWDPVWET